MATLGEYLGAGSGTTKLLLHLNGDANDSSGNGNNGTSTNITYSQANGKFGQGAGFNGSSSKSVSSTAVGGNVNDAKTMICWVKIGSDLSGGNTYSSISSWKFNTNVYIFGYWRESNINKFIFTRDRANVGSQFVNFDNPTAASGWYCLIGTLSGTDLSFYVNGNLVNTITVSTATGALDLGVGWAIGIGPNGTSGYFNGSIDENIYEVRAWSAEEVKKYYTMTKGFYATL